MGERAGGWTRDDVRYLEDSPAASIRKLAERLGRTEAAVKWKRSELGLGGERRWSEADTEFLRKNPRMPVREAARRLGKGESSVHNKRRALGIRSHAWTEKEDKIVRKWHNLLPAEEIADKLPGRTAVAVGIRFGRLGLRSRVFWKDKDVKFLKDNPEMGAAEAARVLGKTMHAVQHKRRGLGITRVSTHKKWTDSDKALLKALTKGGKSAKDVAARMGRTKASIDVMRRKMGLAVPRSERALKRHEEKFLREHPDMPAVEIAKRIGRTLGAVRSWRRKIGLPRYQRHERWTREDTDKLKSNLQRPLSEIYAEFPGRTKASVSLKADSLGRKRLRRKGHTYRHGYKTILSRGGKKAGEHRRVAEEKIGRSLQRKEVVHHINYIRHDNRPENLDVLESQSVHAKIARSVNGLVGDLLDGGEIGYDHGAHSYFFRSRSFGPAGGGRAAPAPLGRRPETSYVFCGDRIFPFPLWTDTKLDDALAELSHAKSVLPMEGRRAVVLCGAAASPALLEGGLGAGASPFPVVRGRIEDYDVVPVRGAAGAGRLVRDALKPSPGASAEVWAALLDSRQLGAMDACTGRGRLCDLVEVPAPVRFGNGEGLSVAHAYVPRRGPSPAHGLRPVRGSPPPLSRVFTQLVRSRARREA